LLEFVGRDATGAFVGVGHSMAAQRMLARFQVGVLHPKDVIRIGAPF
jgi:cytochrome b involved in lipid metabolism